MSKMLEIMSAKDLREVLEGLHCPICTESASNTQLIQLQLDALSELLTHFGTLDVEELPKLEYAWWGYVERIAVVEYGLPYYEDQED
jgi:hypothetical protein